VPDGRRRVSPDHSVPPDFVVQLASGRGTFFLVGARKPLRTALPQPLELGQIEIAQFDRKLGTARNDVGRCGPPLNITDRLRSKCPSLNAVSYAFRERGG